MASAFFELECGEDEPVVMEVVAPGEIILHGWDEEAELAAQELGFEPSACFIIWDAARNDLLNEALIVHSTHHRLGLVAALLAAGADPNTRDDYNRTPLMALANLDGHPDGVQLLLEAGADPHARNKNYKTAMDCALSWNNIDVIELLQDWIEEHG